MSWLNLNQSLNSLKGQITNFASEVLSEGGEPNNEDIATESGTLVKELKDKCRDQELEIASLKKLTDELQATLQSERLIKKNGVKEDESSWYWDPPPPNAKSADQEDENLYKMQIRALQDEISTLKERDTIDLRPDTDEELNRLKEENKNLTRNLEDLDNQHQMAMERLLSLKKELQKNFEVLRQEHEDLKNTNDEYAIEIKELSAKILEKDKELDILKVSKSDYDTLHQKYQNLERIHSLLRENAEKFQEENQDLNEEVFKLQEQVTKYEHDIEMLTKHAELSETVPKNTYDQLWRELEQMKKGRDLQHDPLDEVNIDDNAKSVIETLKRDLSDLRHKLAQKENDYENGKVIHTDKIMQLYNKYVNFELPVDYVGEIPSPGDNVVAFKLESTFKTLNSFKKDIDSLEHKLAEKNLNINTLQTQIDDLTTENDFLSNDLQHFERELEEMKKNNDFLISEIAALKNTSKLEPIIETHEDNLAKLETELADSNRINKTFESEIKRIENELLAVKNEKIALQSSLSDIKEKYTLMLSELDMFKTQSKAVEELESSTIAANTKQLKNMTDEIDDLKKRLNAANAKSEQLLIDVHIIENDKVLLTQQVDNLKHTLDKTTLAHKQSESLNSTLEVKLQELESKLHESIKHDTNVENEKPELLERIALLENQVIGNNKETKPIDFSEVEKLKIEQTQTLEKLNLAINERNTLIDNINGVNTEVANLKKREQELLIEINRLQQISSAEAQNNTSLHETINELKAKIMQQDLVNNEIVQLKEENVKLSERKLTLESELSSTDSKIVHLEEEFEKLISDLNEKDSLIDALNSTINENNANISKRNEEIIDLEKNITSKIQEIEALRHELIQTQDQLNNTSRKSYNNQEDLLKEKDMLNHQITVMNNEVKNKVDEIAALNNKVVELEKLTNEYKTLIDQKDNEVQELRQSMVEATNKSEPTQNNTNADDYTLLMKEKDSLKIQILDVQNNLTSKENDLTELKSKYDQLEKTCIEYRTILENTTSEKTELINLVNLKHNESLQYHNEIQRLNHVILEQSNEFKKVLSEKDVQIQSNNDCSNCENLKITLKEKDEIIKVLNKNLTDFEKSKESSLHSNESWDNLTERCQTLEKNLENQLGIVKKLTAEKIQLSEQHENSSRELERLRHHLVEMEESYTQELMTSEQKLNECQTRLHVVEDRAKQSSTVYTSNSIRANQEVETLRNQIKLLEKQREDVQARFSEAEDARSRSEAALTNLQVVLEQFQLDKERDLHAATEKIRNQMEDLKRENVGLQDEISKLNLKLQESLAGLQAATRLGDQLETKTAQINDLKEQVNTLQTSVSAAEERYYNAISNQQDKVDKNLVKNLVLNYVLTAANSTNKTQVLRILSTVLDFNQKECEKLGLVRAATATDSLAAEFVKFLQEESKPRAALPSMMGLARSTTSSRRSSTMGPTPSPSLIEGHKRNPSTGSNNLLFQNLDAVETTSTVSIESEHRVTSNNEGAILKQVLKDI